MNEKKLTDEKAMFNYIANDVLGSVKPLYLRKRIVGEIFDLIQRLQSENEAWKLRSKELETAWEISSSNEEKLQKQVDELKEQVKTLTSSCQSKNAKIKNLNAEKQALENELNFQHGKPHYRYVIWNTMRNERQFPSICELTESGAYTKLFQKIGWDSAKYRFVVKRIKVDGVEVE